MVQRVAVLVVCAALLGACGKVNDHHDGASPSDGGAAGSAGADGDAVSCPPALASAAEMAATPRIDVNLELLALRLSPGRFIADQATYDRVVRDVGAIRDANASLADIDYWQSTDGRTVSLNLEDQQTLSSMQQGTYHAWDCLNQTYVKTNLELSEPSATFPNYATLTLKGIYDIDQLATEYAKLPGIKSASYGGAGGGDGSTICVTPSADVWHYVFDRAGGDCPAGCTTHEYHHFSTTLGGAVTSLGALKPADVAVYASRDACRGY